MRFMSSVRRWLKSLVTSRHAAGLGAMFLFVAALGLMSPTHFALAFDPMDYAQQFTEVIILFITELLQGITSVIGQLALSLIEMIIVPILQYNGFSTSPTIGLGWKLVRDVVNMFVVLVLLVIAIATIVGYEKVHWQKNLPQFLLAVVLVNFSRTICGILIDLSQVVMFTFVNSLLDVAAGNFAKMFNMHEFGQYAKSALWDQTTGEAKPLEAMAQLGAAYLQFILYAVICAVLLLLALVFIWRIVVLWVLVIMSPLTFFTWGLGGMFKFASGVSGDWWKKFTAALTLGPMLTFFLWLALSTASGDIVTTENFMPVDSAVDNTLENLETSSLLASFLGLTLLIVGMQQSAATANSLGGVAKKYMGDDKFGQKLVGSAITAPFRGARSAANYADRQLGRQGLGQDRLSTAALQMGLQRSGEFARQYAPGITKGVVGRTFANVGGAAQAKMEHLSHESKEAAKKRVSKYTDDQLAEHVRLIAAGEASPISLDAADDVDAIKVRAATDGDFRKALKKKIGDEQYNKFMTEQVLNMSDDHVKHAGGDMDKLAKAKTQNVHLLVDKNEKDEEKLKQQKKKRDDFITSSDKFNPRDMSEDAVKDKEVVEALKKRVVRLSGDGEKITAFDELAKGAYGYKLQQAALEAGTINAEDMKSKSQREREAKEAQEAQQQAANTAAAAAATGAAAAGAAATANVASQGFRRPPRNGGNSGGGNGGGTPPASGGGTPPAGGPGPGPAPAPGGGTPPPAAPSGGGGASASPASAGPSYVSFDNPPVIPGVGNAKDSASDEPLVSFDDGSTLNNPTPRTQPRPSSGRRPPRQARPRRPGPQTPPNPPTGGTPTADA